MHEETRRRLLRAAFALLCVMPTLAIVAWTIAAALPWQARRWEEQVYQQFGLEVQIVRVTHPRPDTRRLHDVTILDGESQRTLARFARLDATRTDQGWRWQIGQMSLPQSAATHWWQIVEHRLVRDDSLAGRVSQIAVERLELTHPERPLVVHRLRWSRAARPDVQHSQLTFHLAEGAADDAVSIELARDRSAPTPSTRLVLDTGNVALPLSLLATLAGHEWSTAASVRGRLPVVWQQGRWQAEFTGELSDLDLAQLSPSWVDVPLQGTAILQVHRSRFDATGLLAIQGWLEIDQLAAPQRLIRSLIQLELFAPGPAYPTVKEQATFTAARLGVAFSLSEMGLVCKGTPDEAGLPVAAVSPSGALLLSNSPVRMNYLICALVPEHSRDVYPKRARLTRCLPATLPRM